MADEGLPLLIEVCEFTYGQDHLNADPVVKERWRTVAPTRWQRGNPVVEMDGVEHVMHSGQWRSL